MTKKLALVQDGALPAHLKTDTARGNENISAEDLKTPRLFLLQGLSPQVTKGKSEYVKGAEPGMFLNSVTNEMSEELYVSNLAYRLVYSVFKKRNLGDKDFRGLHDSAEAAMEHLHEEKLNPNDYDISPQAIHTLAVIDPENGGISGVVEYGMSGTALASSRDWNTQILAKDSNADRFASVWKLTPAFRQNSKGSWYVPATEFAGWSDQDLHNGLTTLFDQIKPKAAA